MPANFFRWRGTKWSSNTHPNPPKRLHVLFVGSKNDLFCILWEMRLFIGHCYPHRGSRTATFLPCDSTVIYQKIGDLPVQEQRDIFVELCAFGGPCKLCAFGGPCKLCAFGGSCKLCAFGGPCKLCAFGGPCKFPTSRRLKSPSQVSKLTVWVMQGQRTLLENWGD